MKKYCLYCKNEIDNNINLCDNHRTFYGDMKNLFAFVNLFKSNIKFYQDPEINIIENLTLETFSKFIYCSSTDIYKKLYKNNDNIVFLLEKKVTNGINLTNQLLLDFTMQILDLKIPQETQKQILDSNNTENILNICLKYLYLKEDNDQISEMIYTKQYEYPEVIPYLAKQYYQINNLYIEQSKKEFLVTVIYRLENLFLKTGNKSIPQYFECLLKIIKNT
jgi:hypothetical protein